MTNAGTLTNDSKGTILNSGQVTNDNVIINKYYIIIGPNVDSGKLINTKCIKNEGTLTINNGEITNSGRITNTGTLSAVPGTGAKATATVTNTGSGKICGAGTYTGLDPKDYSTTCTSLLGSVNPVKKKPKIRWAFNNRTGCRYVHSIRMV